MNSTKQQDWDIDIDMVSRIKTKLSRFTGQQLLAGDSLPNTHTTESFWAPNRVYFPLVEKLREVRRSCPGPASIAFTSTLPGEGVTYVVEGLRRELARQTRERVASVPASELRDGAGFDVFLQDADGIVQQMWEPEVVEDWEKADDFPLQRNLNGLEKRFDYVLVDCPSLKHSSDALVVGKHCVGVCLVVAAGKTTQMQIRGALTTLALAAIPVLGLVLNKRTYPVPEFIYKFL